MAREETMAYDGVVWMRVRLDGAHVLVVGGGGVAARKVVKFLAAGACVEVIAPVLCDALDTRAQDITWRREIFGDKLPEGVQFVVAATDDAEINARVAELCAEAHVPVNVVDASAVSTFHLPASRRTRGVEWALFLGGASPALTVQMMGRLERFFEQEEPWWGEAARVLGERRRAWMRTHRALKGRAGRWRALTRDVVDHVERGAPDEDVEGLFDDVSSDEEMG